MSNYLIRQNEDDENDLVIFDPTHLPDWSSGMSTRVTREFIRQKTEIAIAAVITHAGVTATANLHEYAASRLIDYIRELGRVLDAKAQFNPAYNDPAHRARMFDRRIVQFETRMEDILAASHQRILAIVSERPDLHDRGIREAIEYAVSAFFNAL